MSFRSALVVIGIAGCGSSSSVDEPVVIPAAPPIGDAVAKPKPGLDLAGPIAPPVRTGRTRGSAPAAPLDLIADRAVVRVAVPSVPAGASTTFAFGDDRTGWVTAMPELAAMPQVAYGEGRIFVSGGFYSRTFYALDAATGRIAWATPDLEDNGPTAPVYDDGRVVFNTESCTLFALDAKTGKKLWHRWIGSLTLAQTAVAGGLVFAAHPNEKEGGHELSAFTVDGGVWAWSRWIGKELLAAPVIAGDSVYVSTIGGWTYRFVRATGAQVWAKPLRATTAPWIAGDELFVTRRRAGGKEQQIVVAAATGAIVGEHETSNGAYANDVPFAAAPPEAVWSFEGSRPVVDRGVRYAAMGGEIRASDAATGEPLWQRRYAKHVDERSLGSVALASSEIVVATRDGKLFGLDVDTGYTMWSYDIGHRVIAEPVIAKGWVYATTEDGRVVGLQVGDASLDGWHMFGGNAAHDGLVVQRKPAKLATK